MNYVEGIPNFAQVNAGCNIWRGGQPSTLSAWHFIQSLGVIRVVKLNQIDEGSDAEAMRMGLHVYKTQSIERAIQLMNHGDTFVHCTHGRDRTGAVCIAFRIEHDGWTEKRATEEAERYGYRAELVRLGQEELNHGE